MITFVSGNVRNGKTFFTAMMALLLADSGVKVYTNFSLFDQQGKGRWLGDRWSGKIHPNVKVITPYDLVLMMEAPRRTTNELIALQEVYGWFNSHRSMSDINDCEDTFVFQSGKLGYDWQVDSQLTMRVSGALRNLSNNRYEAEKVTLCSAKYCPNDCPNLANCYFAYYELNPKITNQDIRTGENDINIPFSFARFFWNRYDTWERSQPIGFENMKLKMQMNEPALMDDTIETQVALLLENKEKFGFQVSADVNQVGVKDALIQLHKPYAFADSVTNRLKLRLKYRRE